MRNATKTTVVALLVTASLSVLPCGTVQAQNGARNAADSSGQAGATPGARPPPVRVEVTRAHRVGKAAPRDAATQRNAAGGQSSHSQ